MLALLLLRNLNSSPALPKAKVLAAMYFTHYSPVKILLHSHYLTEIQSPGGSMIRWNWVHLTLSSLVASTYEAIRNTH